MGLFDSAKDLYDAAKGIASDALGEDGVEMLNSIKQSAIKTGTQIKNAATDALNNSDSELLNKAKSFSKGVKQEKESDTVTIEDYEQHDIESEYANLVPAICTQCGAPLNVDPSWESAVCTHCGTTFVVSKAINQYQVEHANIRANTVQVHKKGTVEATLSFIEKRREQKKEAERQEAERRRIEEERRKAQEAAKRAKRRAWIKRHGLKTLLAFLLAVIIFTAAGTVLLTTSRRGKISAGISSSELLKNNYTFAEQVLRKAGFSDITLLADPDLVLGLFNSDGQVKSISIGTKTSFSSLSYFEADEPVVITYHTYPSKVNSEKEENPTNDPILATTVPASPTPRPAPTQAPTPKPTIEPTPESKTVSYSTNDKETAKNGDSGVFSYKSKDGSYDNYIVIDFNAECVYYYSDGNGDETCMRVNIDYGNLNDGLVVTFRDGDTQWSEGLHFNWRNSPEHLILEDNDHFTYDYYSTDLQRAFQIFQTKTVYDYSTTSIPTIILTPEPTSSATTAATDEPAVDPYTLYADLGEGSYGDNVRELQSRLIQLGYLNDSADGSFGGNTRAAVEAFQNENGFPVDGIASAAFQIALFSEDAIPARWVLDANYESDNSFIPISESIPETASTPTREIPQQSGPMVWIPTNGGTKYHSKPSCSSMVDPAHVTLDEAVSLGFTPCGRCC